MKTSKFFYLTLSLVSLMILSACSDDPEEVASQLIGDYVITEAILTESLTITTNEIGPFEIPVDTDITQMIQQALLGAVECTPEKSLIELREDNSLFISCKDSDAELDAGTWEEVSETVIKLNLNSTAVPISPTGIVLTVSDVVIDGDVLSGITTVPLPKEMLATVVANMSNGLATLNMEATPEAVPATFMIELTKQ